MRNFRELRVWVKAHTLTVAVYQATRALPKNEEYGLSSQIRRSAASICANIAEGCGRDGKKELNRFLQIARGSASELEYHLLLAADLKFIDRATYDRLATSVIEIKRMLSGFVRYLKADG